MSARGLVQPYHQYQGIGVLNRCVAAYVKPNTVLCARTVAYKNPNGAANAFDYIQGLDGWMVGDLDSRAELLAPQTHSDLQYKHILLTYTSIFI